MREGTREMHRIKVKEFVISLTVVSGVLTVIPWLLALLSPLLQLKVMRRCVDIIYSFGWLWWLVSFGLAVIALVETIRWKVKKLMAVIILLLIIIPVAAVVWLGLVGLFTHPPA
jgi:hypothetical protein